MGESCGCMHPLQHKKGRHTTEADGHETTKEAQKAIKAISLADLCQQEPG